MISTTSITLFIIMLPLFAGSLVGIFGHWLRALPSQLLTTLSIGSSLLLSAILSYQYVVLHHVPIDQSIYIWALSNAFQLNIGFMIDPLSAMMACVVCFISFLVHIYSIGYMADDPSKQRFFSYISLFTFMMLTLVFANNLLLLFFGWEGVGLMSYLLIGFWFNKDSANAASLKAFYLNRIADFALLIGISGIFSVYHSLDYAQIFLGAPHLATMTISLIPGHTFSTLTLLCLLIFVGAMGKSAQMPFHVWLPESMEGPTPISALIHAATMVTAGIYMLARLSPLFEYSATTLSVVLIVGATSALFMGILGIVENNIKRIIAYSTLSQLGYMMAGAGASAFSASIFHLFTHACFKALLFLAAGSVIIALHHEQDIRKMGGLVKKLPITYSTFLCGAMALIALPPTSGFYSKDSIINAVHSAHLFGATYAYLCLTIGVFFTALYTFRCFFLVFHTPCRYEDPSAIHETSSLIWIPLILLAIPSLGLGYYMIQPLLVNTPSWFGNALFVFPGHNPLIPFLQHFQGPIQMALESLQSLPFWLMIAGVVTAWVAYVSVPRLPALLVKYFRWPYEGLVNKYGFDAFYERVFVKGTRHLAYFFFDIIDMKLIDDFCVNGSGKMIQQFSKWARKLQSGYLYQYVFIMIVGLLILLYWQIG